MMIVDIQKPPLINPEFISETNPALASISVIIVTYSRPECVRRCLDHLRLQTARPEQIIVVDADVTNRTKAVVDDFDEVLYLRNEYGYGGMTISRNIGLAASTGKIVAYVDDDALPKPNWVESIIDGYSSNDIAAVGGRALNNQPNEGSIGISEIGQITKFGDITGNFAADPGKILEVDHIIGCNMSFRADIIKALGGFRPDFPGTNLCEDTDMSIRLRRLGYKIVFNPQAVVEHLGAPQPVGERFDLRWDFYNAQNHTLMLIRNFGFNRLVLTFLVVSSLRRLKAFVRKQLASFARLAVGFAGQMAGVCIGVRMLMQNGLSPVRRETDPTKNR